MVEYTRLIGGEWLQRIVSNWQRHDTITLVAVAAVILLVGYFIMKR